MITKITNKKAFFTTVFILFVYIFLVFSSDRYCVGLGMRNPRICFDEEPVSFIFIFLVLLISVLLLLSSWVRVDK